MARNVHGPSDMADFLLRKSYTPRFEISGFRTLGTENPKESRNPGGRLRGDRLLARGDPDDERRDYGDGADRETSERKDHVIHTLSRERIQDARGGVPAEEPAGVRVVVDARHQDAPEDPDHGVARDERPHG